MNFKTLINNALKFKAAYFILFVSLGKDNRRKNEKASNPCGRNLLVCCGGKGKIKIGKWMYLQPVFFQKFQRIPNFKFQIPDSKSGIWNLEFGIF